MASSVTLDRVHVVSAGQPILHDVSLRVAEGESVAIIGRSGAGKTTLLRLVNGMVRPDRGTVAIDGVPLHGDLVARRRSIGTILQSPALFPHRSVFDNVATVPRLLGWPEDRIRRTATDLLGQLEMSFDRFASRFPRSLSGGEQQRVSIARAMITAPPLLVCDEPFSALDPLVRRDLQEAFIALRSHGDTTMLFVTHDVGEALRVGRRIVLIDGGAIVLDAPREEFIASSLPLVRRFIDAARLPDTKP